VRIWLNGAFLESFSEEERSVIQDANHAVLLSHATKESATSGSKDFFCSHIPILAARGYRQAYQITVSDRVTLPGIDLISQMAQNGADISEPGMYWLETPYFNNGYMVRCVYPDGYIYFREASEAAGVRPVIRIAVTDILSGTGSAANPFVCALP
jgi:hypothetical protein